MCDHKNPASNQECLLQLYHVESAPLTVDSSELCALLFGPEGTRVLDVVMSNADDQAHAVILDPSLSQLAPAGAQPSAPPASDAVALPSNRQLSPPPGCGFCDTPFPVIPPALILYFQFPRTLNPRRFKKPETKCSASITCTSKTRI